MAAQESSTRSGGILAPWLIVGLLIAIIALGVGLVRFRPDLARLVIATGTAANDAAHKGDGVTLQPTLTAAQLAAQAQAANRTAAEQQTLRQAIPTEDTSKPPMLPVEATAAAIQQPAALDGVPAQSLSPVDLTYRPVPTPTTMLSQEQYDASQASEEQNFLNQQMQSLTPAQQMVQVHEAEYQASNP